MIHHLQQGFVDLGDFRLAADEVAKLALHRRERRLDNAALVVVRGEFIAPEIVEVEQPIPGGRGHVRLRLRVVPERDEGRGSHLIDERDHLAAAVRLSADTSAIVKFLPSLFEQGLELRDVVAVGSRSRRSRYAS